MQTCACMGCPMQRDHPETQRRGVGGACTLRQVFATDVNDWAGEAAGAPRAGRPSEPAMAWSVLCQRDRAERQGRVVGGACTLRQVCATSVNDWAGEGAGAPRASRPSEPAMAWSVLCQRDHAERQGRGVGGACTLRQVFATDVNDWAGEGAGAPRASRPCKPWDGLVCLVPTGSC